MQLIILYRLFKDDNNDTASSCRNVPRHAVAGSQCVCSVVNYSLSIISG